MTTRGLAETFEASTNGSSGVKDALRKLIQRMETTEWVQCPSCLEEWNKLRPCRYLDAEMKPVWLSICVDCAESIQGIEFAAALLPSPGVEIEKKWIGPSHYKAGKLLGNLTAKVSYGAIVFAVIRLGGGHISFREASSEKERRADNILAAWSMMRHEIENPQIKPGPTRKIGRGGYDWGQD